MVDESLVWLPTWMHSYNCISYTYPFSSATHKHYVQIEFDNDGGYISNIIFIIWLFHNKTFRCSINWFTYLIYDHTLLEKSYEKLEWKPNVKWRYQWWLSHQYMEMLTNNTNMEIQWEITWMGIYLFYYFLRDWLNE